jgi:hypothetical protein
MGDTTQFADAGFKLLWIPHWTSEPQPRVPAKDWGGHGWTFWQYASCGDVPGVNGCTDMDRFNGTDLTATEYGIAPANTAAPTVSGQAEETSTLTAAPGGWSGSAPLEYSYRWRRCDSGGGSCAYIPGADARTYTLSAADVGTLVSVEVTAANAIGSSAAESNRTTLVEPYDVTPPSVPVFTAPAGRYLVSTSVPVAWSSTDDRSGVGSYHVRVRIATAAGVLGGYRDVFASTPSTQTTYVGAAGRTYCFSAMATDRWENASGWSGERCVTVPIDERSFTASDGWVRQHSSGYFHQTALGSTTPGSTLTRTGLNARRIRLVAQTCPTCGRAQVLWNGYIVGAFDLVTKRTLRCHLMPEITLPALSTGGTLVVRVASAKRPVVIDGVAVTQL